MKAWTDQAHHVTRPELFACGIPNCRQCHPWLAPQPPKESFAKTLLGAAGLLLFAGSCLYYVLSA
jgi:hypothetical protein